MSLTSLAANRPKPLAPRLRCRVDHSCACLGRRGIRKNDDPIPMPSTSTLSAAYLVTGGDAGAGRYPRNVSLQKVW